MRARPLRALQPAFAFLALLALPGWSLFALRTGRARWALRSGLAVVPRRPLRTLWPWRALRSGWSRWSVAAWRPLDALWAGATRRSGTTRHPRASRRSWGACSACDARCRGGRRNVRGDPAGLELVAELRDLIHEDRVRYPQPFQFVAGRGARRGDGHPHDPSDNEQSGSPSSDTEPAGTHVTDRARIGRSGSRRRRVRHPGCSHGRPVRESGPTSRSSRGAAPRHHAPAES
jgi:hypothetical protein